MAREKCGEGGSGRFNIAKLINGTKVYIKSLNYQLIDTGLLI